MKAIWIILGLTVAILVLGWFFEGGGNSTGIDDSPSMGPSKSRTEQDANGGSLPLLTQTNSIQWNPRLRRGSILDWEESTTNDWEQDVETIVGSDTDDAQKAEELLQMFPELPEDGQVEVVQYLDVLLPNAMSDALVLASYLADPTTPVTVQEAIMAGLLGRPDSVRLPLLLSMAQNPQHPRHEEARGLLQAILGQDFGDDWGQWNEAVADALQSTNNVPEVDTLINPPEMTGTNGTAAATQSR